MIIKHEGKVVIARPIGKGATVAGFHPLALAFSIEGAPARMATVRYDIESDEAEVQFETYLSATRHTGLHLRQL